jgi:hypothetical protein
MNEKNEAALSQWGAKQILSELVNVPTREYLLSEFVGGQAKPPSPEDAARAQKFFEKNGPLLHNHGDKNDQAINHLLLSASGFRRAWKAMDDDEEARLLNLHLDDIFSYEAPVGKLPAAFYGVRPVFAADFRSGRWRPIPRTLLDRLALELVDSRKMLHVCERPECQRYFVKEFSRDRYCSVRCGGLMRKLGQSTWARENRKAVAPKAKKKRK